MKKMKIAHRKNRYFAKNINKFFENNFLGH